MPFTRSYQISIHQPPRLDHSSKSSDQGPVALIARQKGDIVTSDDRDP